jgi:hypothetical protein
MQFDAPFMLGPFAVDPFGRLQPHAPEATPSVHVRWRGTWVTGRLAATPGEEGAAQDGARGQLSLSAVIGRVRSTAGPRPGLRAQALETLRELIGTMPQGWRMRLQPDHSARVEAERAVSLPVTATALLTAFTCFLLDLAPYLDMLAEPDAGFEAVCGGSPIAVGSTAGMVNT